MRANLRVVTFATALFASAGSAMASTLEGEVRCTTAPVLHKSPSKTLAAIEREVAVSDMTRPDGAPQTPGAYWGASRYTSAVLRDKKFHELKKMLGCFGLQPVFVDSQEKAFSPGKKLTAYRVESYRLAGPNGPSVSLHKFDYDGTGEQNYHLGMEFYFVRGNR